MPDASSNGLVQVRTLVGSGVRRARQLAGPVGHAVRGRAGKIAFPGRQLDPTVGLPALPTTHLDRSGDLMSVRISGDRVFVRDGQLVTPSSGKPGVLRIEFTEPQHWVEPTEQFALAGPRRAPADPTRLDLTLGPGETIPFTLEGVLHALQTHVLATTSRVGLPAKLLLQPVGLVAADDVPVAPADDQHASFRERWHFSLRALTPQRFTPGVPVWRRTDVTRWRVYRSEGGTHPDIDSRPEGSQPDAQNLVDLQEKTAWTKSALTGVDLVLSGGGASGELTGAWTSGSLKLYRERFMTGRTTVGVTANDGLVYPFGLRAVEVKTWQRVLVDEPGGARGAYLDLTIQLVFKETGRDLTATPVRSPFDRVDVVNPVRDGIPASYGDRVAHPLPLITYLARDRAGVTHRIEVPGYFIRSDAQGTDLTTGVAELLATYAPSDDPTGTDQSASGRRTRSPELSQALLGTHGARITYRSDVGSSAPPGAGPASVYTQQIRFRFPAGTTAGSANWSGAVPPPTAPAPPPEPEVDWFTADLTQLGEFTGRSVSAMMRYPTTPVAGVLLEPVEPITVALDPSSRSGAFCSPSYQVNSLTKQGAVHTPALAEADQTSPFLGDHLPHLLGPFQLIEFLAEDQRSLSPSITADGDVRRLSYGAKLKGSKSELGNITLVAKGDLKVEAAVGPKSTGSTTTITGLTVNLLGLIEVSIKSCTIAQGSSGLQVSGTIDPPRLVGSFGILQQVLDAVPSDLFSNGPYVRVAGASVTAGVVLDLPSVAFGVFAIRNLTLDISVGFVLGGGGIAVDLALGTLARPFQIGAGIFVGGGHVAFGAVSDGKKITPRGELSVEMGAGVSVDLALVSGVVQAVAGLSMQITGTDVTVGGYVRILGSVCVKYLGSMTVRAEITLSYNGKNRVFGHGSYTIEIDVFLLSTSVSVGFDYSFKTSNGDPPLLELLASVRGAENEWADYWGAFGLLDTAVT